MEIEPCCFSRQLSEVLSGMTDERHSIVSIYNTGEWTLAQLLSWMEGNGADVRLLVARPTLSQPTIEALALLMDKTTVNSQRKTTHVIRRLEIVTEVNQKTLSLLIEYLSPYGDRVRIAHCIHRTHLLYLNPDRPRLPLMVLGELPEYKSHADCVCMMSNNPSFCEDAVGPIRGLMRVNTVKKRLVSLTS